jgi:hypothetical protein
MFRCGREKNEDKPFCSRSNSNTCDGAAAGTNDAGYSLGGDTNQGQDLSTVGRLALFHLVAALDWTGVALVVGASHSKDGEGESDKDGNFGEHGAESENEVER